MSEQNQFLPSAQPKTLQEISDIKRMMERSSRFISLSGLSGIAAGLCALGGALVANSAINFVEYGNNQREGVYIKDLRALLLLIAATVLVSALLLAFFFTWRRARKNHLPIWDLTARKLLWNVCVPLIAGGAFILAMLQYHEWHFVGSACLIFYGLALVNGSKYTLSEIRYLGYCEITLGLVNTQFIDASLYFWAFGFGVLHIIYGGIMWWKYERSQ